MTPVGIDESAGADVIAIPVTLAVVAAGTSILKEVLHADHRLFIPLLAYVRRCRRGGRARSGALALHGQSEEDGESADPRRQAPGPQDPSPRLPRRDAASEAEAAGSLNWPLILVAAVVGAALFTLLCMWIAMRAAGPQTHGYNLGSVQFDIAPSWSGKAKVYIPIAGWEIEAPIFSAPYAFHAQPRHVSPARGQAGRRTASARRSRRRRANSRRPRSSPPCAPSCSPFWARSRPAPWSCCCCAPSATGGDRGLLAGGGVSPRSDSSLWARAASGCGRASTSRRSSGRRSPSEAGRDWTNSVERFRNDREGELGHPGPLAPHRSAAITRSVKLRRRTLASRTPAAASWSQVVARPPGAGRVSGGSGRACAPPAAAGAPRARDPATRRRPRQASRGRAGRARSQAR